MYDIYSYFTKLEHFVDSFKNLGESGNDKRNGDKNESTSWVPEFLPNWLPHKMSIRMQLVSQKSHFIARKAW